MTPLEDAYMLEESCKLSFAVVRDIFDHGFSRVPVYARERQHVVGLLFVKDLIFVDLEDEELAISDPRILLSSDYASDDFCDEHGGERRWRAGWEE